ncbi:MAG: glycosyltransferase, partial [Spirochaetes bacterium]|nr:glycosyltransferase [Spirochaetota bacterium]
GRVAPDATFTQEETHAAVLMARLCELAVYSREPGLLATLLAGESAFDRAVALSLVNLFGEFRRHQFTTLFLKGLRSAFQGKRPPPLLRRLAPKGYRPHLEALDRLALARRHDVARFHLALARVLPDLVRATDALLAKKILKNLHRAGEVDPDLLGSVDIPAELRALMAGLPGNLVSPTRAVRRVRMRLRGGLGKVLDEFSFPGIASVFFGALSFAACRNLTRHRAVHRAFARSWGLDWPAPRVLWLTDTFHDHNGVSRFLTSLHREAVERGLPIDFLICSSTREGEAQLKVLRPYCEFRLEKYQDQLVRLPSLLEAHRLFAEGGYDQVVSSTEFPMGLVALYFKFAFHVPAWLYMHTDWLDFARKTLKLDPASMERAEKLFRFLYGRFNDIFVLNREHESWLTGAAMGCAPDRVHRTAHWADACFTPRPDRRRERFGAREGERVLLFAGRISDEKGVFDLPRVWAAARERFPATRLVFAGTGPALERMKDACPEADYLGWVDPGELPEIYSSADLLLMPSRFDTFGCVVLEALSCGLPVVAYDSKGPGDIIEHGKSGYLVEDLASMTRACLEYLENPARDGAMKAHAVERSGHFTATKIIGGLVRDLGLAAPGTPP